MSGVSTDNLEEMQSISLTSDSDTEIGKMSDSAVIIEACVITLFYQSFIK